MWQQIVKDAIRFVIHAVKCQLNRSHSTYPGHTPYGVTFRIFHKLPEQAAHEKNLHKSSHVYMGYMQPAPVHNTRRSKACAMKKLCKAACKNADKYAVLCHVQCAGHSEESVFRRGTSWSGTRHLYTERSRRLSGGQHLRNRGFPP